MEFDFAVGQSEKHAVHFERNGFTGRLRVLVDQQEVLSRSPFNPANHFSLTLTKKYEFQVGSSEPHKIRIEKIRPLLGAGFRAHTYSVFIDEQLHSEHHGY